jgi:hypothetical protein
LANFVSENEKINEIKRKLYDFKRFLSALFYGDIKLRERKFFLSVFGAKYRLNTPPTLLYRKPLVLAGASPGYMNFIHLVVGLITYPIYKFITSVRDGARVRHSRPTGPGPALPDSRISTGKNNKFKIKI